MIRIGKPKRGLVLPLGPGASLTYRQATSIDREAALHAAREFFQSVRAGARALSELGLDIGDAASLTEDEGLSSGVSLLVFNVELCMRCVASWEGVGDETGAQLALTRENVADLLRDPALYALISSALMARLVEMDEEGNASALSPNGAPAGAPPTAGAAAN
ncbi:MAG: hypothetical protein FJX45_10430 [Alphaproteobacteria bacterium]|nr:hypothetical protein [Alphaproteobacteria bacterium]MBM3654821.1 hypothetical protein [Alphaproteobacteria bacterium]